MQTITTTTIHFPEVTLPTRDAHKLRGYFGRLFQQHSPLLHNHLEGGDFRYGYPLVQYKVINHVPVLFGLEEGARLLVKLFTQIKQLEIAGQTIPLYNKRIQLNNSKLGLIDGLHTYQFDTLWMALNQKNYQQYATLNAAEQKQQIQKILTGNILSLFKATGYWAKQQVLVTSTLQAHRTKFKDQAMTAFKGQFSCNAELTDYCGLGKAVSRGFGTITKQTT